MKGLCHTCLRSNVTIVTNNGKIYCVECNQKAEAEAEAKAKAETKAKH